MEKEMATYSSILAWEFSWTEEPSRLQSMGLLRVGHDLATKPLPPYTGGQILNYLTTNEVLQCFLIKPFCL